jgi:ligand-binding sensor domain-containing protein
MKATFFKLLILIVGFLYCTTSAQTKLSDFDHSTLFDKKDGLANNFVHAVVEDYNGFIWVTGDHGISRFDGTHFTNFEFYTENSITFELGTIYTQGKLTL